ncbi:hypothetical protein [Fructobacillus cardui]|uniref:Uncharacterized protein n=1 Tax=Fructobacillus cardui TaxID=2893170 RepID=A0ABN9YSX8_9LACO|nr:hypothetical protein [Fructobacillus cardui]MCK8628174.1 hypothetical protein [Fructobacillus cardui]CAK1243428.1 unnamed protein product [Fructobacillus cardui]
MATTGNMVADDMALYHIADRNADEIERVQDKLEKLYIKRSEVSEEVEELETYLEELGVQL